MIYDSQWGIEISQLNSLLSWGFSRQDKKIITVISGSVTFNVKVFLTLWTLNYVDYVPFFVLILSILFTNEPTNFKKNPVLEFAKKMIKPPLRVQ